MIALCLLAATVAYAVAGVLYVLWMVRPREAMRRGGLVVAVVATVVAGATAALVLTEAGAHALPGMARMLVLATTGACVVVMLLRVERRLPLLGTVLYPLAAAVMLASYVSAAGIGAAAPSPAIGSFTALHIGATLLGFLMLVPAYVLSVLFLDQEHRLKAKRPGGGRLPSLLTLERSAWRLLYVGFPLLTAGILLGVLWQESAHVTVKPQHVLAAASWCVYSYAIYRRVRTGWRGQRAALSLMAAFVGTFGAVLMYAMR